VEKKLSQIQAILIKTSYQTYIPHLYRAFVAVTSELLKDGHSDSIRTELRQRLEELRKLESNVLQSWMTEAETTRRNIVCGSIVRRTAP
jgi:rRNA pseudouridine-1189 N-methylase Emg1 (Nep1/Mra1 family)